MNGGTGTYYYYCNQWNVNWFLDFCHFMASSYWLFLCYIISLCHLWNRQHLTMSQNWVTLSRKHLICPYLRLPLLNHTMSVQQRHSQEESNQLRRLTERLSSCGCLWSLSSSSQWLFSVLSLGVGLSSAASAVILTDETVLVRIVVYLLISLTELFYYIYLVLLLYCWFCTMVSIQLL